MSNTENMTPVEDYFFTQNITVVKKMDLGTIIYYSTDDGQYVENFAGKLFKEVETKKFEEVIL